MVQHPRHWKGAAPVKHLGRDNLAARVQDAESFKTMPLRVASAGLEEESTLLVANLPFAATASGHVQVDVPQQRDVRHVFAQKCAQMLPMVDFPGNFPRSGCSLLVEALLQ